MRLAVILVKHRACHRRLNATMQVRRKAEAAAMNRGRWESRWPTARRSYPRSGVITSNDVAACC